MCVTRFQSTLPVRGATAHTERDASGNEISIHAPRAGSDRQKVERQPSSDHFNPRSPCGERQCQDRRKHRPYHFNPRSPCGERPTRAIVLASILLFQSTLPVRGATSSPRKRLTYAMIFQSTLPVRGATMPSGSNSVPLPLFQSTLPVRGATMTLGKAISWKIFQSTLPVRGAT